MKHTINGETEKIIRCAIYTRKSTEDGLEQEYNTLDAQRDSCESYIQSQASRGWRIIDTQYDDGGFTGANVERPAYSRLIADIQAGLVDMVLVYKVDRLSRSLADFANIMAMFDKAGVSFVSITQHFDTSSSLGRMTLNILITFAQFEREMIAERIRDKIASSRKRGKYIGGIPVLGFDVNDKKLHINKNEAEQVNAIFKLYIELHSVRDVANKLNERCWTTKKWVTKREKLTGGLKFSGKNVHAMLSNPIYIGKVTYKGEVFEGEHDGIVDENLFNDVQALLKDRSRPEYRNKKKKHPSLLRGILYCGECGHVMTKTYASKAKGKVYFYYVCNNVLKNTRKACKSKRIPALKVEDFIVKQISAIGKNKGLTDGLVKKAELEQNTLFQQLKMEKDGVETALKITYKQLSNGELNNENDSIEKYQTRIRELDLRMASLDNLSLTPKGVSHTLKKFMPIWDTLEGDQKEKIVSLIFEKITWNSESESLDFEFNPLGMSLLKNGGSHGYNAQS